MNIGRSAHFASLISPIYQGAVASPNRYLGGCEMHRCCTIMICEFGNTNPGVHHLQVGRLLHSQNANGHTFALQNN